MRGKRGRKWKITLILLLVLVLCTAAAVTALVVIRRTRTPDLIDPIDVSGEMYQQTEDDASLQKAASYASGLCVSDCDVACAGVAISDSACGALFDLDSRSVLFAQGLHEKVYPASVTKIMTALVALRYGNMDDIVTIPESAVDLEEGSTEIGFSPGDQVSMSELFRGLLVYSGNDAAMAIARHVGGDVDTFVDMMNEEAKKIGATNTHFVNPTGLHDEDHYTTVYDVYLMLNEAIGEELFLATIQMDSCDLTYSRGADKLTAHLESTDRYLTRQVSAPKNVTVLGGKTGTTTAAGSCLALLSQNAYGEPYISIIMHAPTKAILYDNMNQLLGQINS